MNEQQQQAYSTLEGIESTGIAFETIARIKPDWEYAENFEGWLTSHVTSVEGDEADKIAANACNSIADEVRGVLFDAIHNALNP